MRASKYEACIQGIYLTVQEAIELLNKHCWDDLSGDLDHKARAIMVRSKLREIVPHGWESCKDELIPFEKMTEKAQKGNA